MPIEVTEGSWCMLEVRWVRTERCPCTNTGDGLEEVLLIAQHTKAWRISVLYSIGAVALEKNVEYVQRRSKDSPYLTFGRF